jgi:anti-sigma regulatory factor (Ser/Thr protein kinase)
VDDDWTRSSAMVTVTVAPHRVGLIRAMLETLLLRVDFSVETTSDLVLAVTEICEQIVERSDHRHPLTCSVVTGPHAADGEIRGVVQTGRRRLGVGVGWQLVNASVDHVDVTSADCPDGRDVVVSFSKLREPA